MIDHADSSSPPLHPLTGEVIPNVEGVVPYLREDVDEFADLLGRFRRGELTEAELTGHRLLRGVYGQRQAARQMIRIKIPLGYMGYRQLEELGRVISQYAPLGKGHFTTRENLQIHHVPLDVTPQLLHQLGSVGLSTREACGNTVRNVTGCALAGVCPDEVFDASPYGAAFARYFVRREFTQRMPRKFKTAFVGCKEDHALVRIHDLGFAGVIRWEDGRPVKGFRIMVGGGTSIEAIIAPVLYDFVSVDDGAYLRVAEAVLRVFNRSDELRKNRMKARIKVLVKRVGIDAFRELVEQEMKEPWAREPLPLDELFSILPNDHPSLPAADSPPSADRRDRAFEAWVGSNVISQRQPGFYAATVTIPAGDVVPEQCAQVARLAAAHGNGTIRVTPDQNLVIRWVPGDHLYALWQQLARAGLGDAGAHQVTDVVSCPGTDSCKLGITASMGLNRAVRDALLRQPDIATDSLIERMRIRISGCPNGCGQHHISDLGFHGAACKGDQRMMVPAYEVFLGGTYRGSEVRYGTRLATKVPAKALPGAVLSLLRLYRDRRQADERFDRFVDRLGKDAFEEVLRPLVSVPAFDAAAPDFYQDWERTGVYKVERGEGECAM